MTHTDLLDFYEKRKSTFNESLQGYKRQINFISNIRLGVALIFIGVTYFAFTHHTLFYALPLVLFVFILLVRRHAALFDKKTHLENLVKIQHAEIETLHGNYGNNSSGSAFIDFHHPYTHDLDIFGEGSVFQYISRHSTAGGKKLLAGWLSQKAGSADEIRARQQAIRELSSKHDFRQEVQALAMEVDEQSDDQRQIEQWLSQPSFIYGKRSYRYILNVFPLITVSLVITAFFVEGVRGFAVLAAGLQWVFLGFHMKRVNAFHQYIGRKTNTIAKFARILFFIRNEKYASEKMQSLGASAGDADEKVKRLAALLTALDARLNMMTNLVVNSLLLYDLQCVYRLERWKEEHARQLPMWLDTIREIEALSILGTFTFNHPRFNFPGINESQKLSATNLGHPLLDENERICNDLYLDHRQSIMIITGANMAGKSTFLRALGVNTVLALSGAPVCATDFQCPFIEIRSGMRTADSLKENQSYFFAELDRLKSIMDELRSGTPLLILLDEILKGTNSTDKQAGSVALVRQLVDYPCLTIIATHDLALGELEQVYPGRILNYCFEANIENDHLSFDYKLKRGLAQKMNATFLMKKMGIIT